MIQQDHLQVFDLTLTAHAPVFIGSGTEYKKNEYCFNHTNQMVSILNRESFFRLLMEQKMADRYEQFIFGHGENLYSFLTRECFFTPEQIRGITRYQISASDALNEDHSLKEIHAFLRGPDGKVYIPGSSVKGALRTAILLEMMQQNKKDVGLIRKKKETAARWIC